MYMNLQSVADNAREYCETTQSREFELDGACHENVVGAGDYVRMNTNYDPIIVWGVVSHSPEKDTADSISNVSESKTHFWLELEGVSGIVDVYTNNPLVGNVSDCIESGIAYGGEQPDCYNSVEKFKYYGQVTASDLTSKDSFKLVRTTVKMV